MKTYYEQDGITIYHGDCSDVFCHLGRVDSVITDPPYDAKTHAGARTKSESERIAIDFAPLDIAETLPRLLTICRSWCVCFCSMEMIGEYSRVSGESWVRGGFWRKINPTPQFTGDRPGTPGEAIAIMHPPGKKRWNGGGHAGFWEYGIERIDRYHPTQKPEALMVELIRLFTNYNEKILDPFMGSGTTLVAAKRLGRKAIGIEIEEKYCEIAAKRLAQGALPMFTA